MGIPGRVRTPARPRLAMGVVGAAVAAGAVGVGLAAADVRSPVRTALVLVFLAVAPTAAVAGLLRTLDMLARLIISGTTTICLLAIVAIVMLAEGVWSPVGGLLVVTGITAACLAAQLPPVRRGCAACVAAARAKRSR